MQIAEYYTIRRAVQDNAPAPDGTAVAAMEIELRAALLASGLFHTVEVGRSDDPDRLVLAMVQFAPELDASEAALALARLWTKQIAYGFWQALTIRVDKRQVELQGATRLSFRGHYCTVHLIAQEAPQPVTQPVFVQRPAPGRQTPGTGLAQTSAAVVSDQPARRSRRWLTGRPVAVA